MEVGICEICHTSINPNVSLCDTCDKLVEDWNETNDSYKRKDGKGTYRFNHSTGTYVLTK